MQRTIRVVSTILVSFSAGCVSVQMATSIQDEQARAFTAPSHGGRVYFFRRYKYVGCAVSLPLEINNQHVADLAVDTFAYFDLPLGVHTLSTNGPVSPRTSIKINIKPQQVYFVRQSISMEALGNRYPVRLSRADDDAARKDIRHCRLVEVYSKPIESTVAESIQQASGTGFAISDQGHILTAYHVVQNGSRVRVRFGHDDWLDAVIIRHSSAFDVALLKVDAKPTSHLPLCEVGSSEQGKSVFTIGFPAPSILGAASKYTEGVISSTTGVGDEASLLQVTVPAQPGNSGGALVSDNECVLGLITSTAAVSTFFNATGTLPQNVTWAVNADYFRPFLSGIPELAKLSVMATPLESQGKWIERVRAATCIVKVVR
jgi:S1-C subfamily serine protease